jgi:hypothetical protein
VELQDLAESLDGQGLGETRNPLDQEMAAAEERGHHPVHERSLTDDDLLDLGDGGLDLERFFADELVQPRDVCLGLRHGHRKPPCDPFPAL